MKIWITFEIEDTDLDSIDQRLKIVRKLTDNLIALGFPYKIKITSMPRKIDISKEFKRADQI